MYNQQEIEELQLQWEILHHQNIELLITLREVIMESDKDFS